MSTLLPAFGWNQICNNTPWKANNDTLDSDGRKHDEDTFAMICAEGL